MIPIVRLSLIAITAPYNSNLFNSCSLHQTSNIGILHYSLIILLSTTDNHFKINFIKSKIIINITMTKESFEYRILIHR